METCFIKSTTCLYYLWDKISVKTVMQPISLTYKNVSAKYPEKFSLELEN